MAEICLAIDCYLYGSADIALVDLTNIDFVFVILGNKLSLVTKDEESQYLAVLRFKRITQAELNSILATR